MSEYGYKENTETPVDTSPEMSDAQIDDSGTAEQADTDFDAEIDNCYEIPEDTSEVEEAQAENADVDFDADTDSGFEAGEEIPKEHTENMQEASDAENADADFDRDVESEEQSEAIDESEEDSDHAESSKSEQFEDKERNPEDADFENAEASAENVDFENTEGNAEDVGSENMEDNAEYVDSENAEDNTENVDSENTEENAEDIDAENTEENGEDIDSENTEDNAEDVDSENTEDNAEDVDSENTVDNAEDVDAENTEDDVEDVDSENTEGNAGNENFEDKEDKADDIDSENTEDNAEDVDAENAEDNGEDVDDENTEDNAEDVNAESVEDNVEDVDAENAEDNAEDIDSENTEDNAEDVDSENTEDSAEDVDSENTEDNAEDVGSENTEDNAEDVDSENTEDNGEDVDDENTEDNAEDVNAESAEDNAEDVDAENTEDNGEDANCENTEDNAEDVNAESAEDNAEDVDVENAEDNGEDIDDENTQGNAEEADDEDTECPEETIEDSDETEEDNEEVPEEELPEAEETKEPIENQEDEAEPQEEQQEKEKQQEKAQEKPDKAEKRPAIAPMPISKHQQEASEKTESQPESKTSPVSRGSSQEVAAMQYESAAIVAPTELGDTITPEHGDRSDEHKDSEEKSADEADASADEDQSSSASPSAQQDEDQQAGQNAANSTQTQTGFSNNSGQIVSNDPQPFPSMANDPQANSVNAPASPQDRQEEAFQALLAYMAAHNYGMEDAPIYQKDPDWQKLQRAAYPDWAPPKSAEVRRMEEPRFGTIPAASILEVDSTGEYFWQEHSLTKADYLALARDIPEVQQRMDSGASLEDLKKDSRLGACAAAYFDPAKMVKVEHDHNGFHFSDDGRHRISAARELGINMPVLIIERKPNGSAEGNESRQPVQEMQEQMEERPETKSLKIGEVWELAETLKQFDENEKELLENQKFMADLELPGQRMKGVQVNGVEGATDQIDKVNQSLKELRECSASIGAKTEVEALVAARYQRIGRTSSEVLMEMQSNRRVYEWVLSERDKLASMGNGEGMTDEQIHDLGSSKAALSAYLSENSETMCHSFGLTLEEYQRKIESLSNASPRELRQEYGKIGTLAWDKQSELSWKSWKEMPQRSAEYVLFHGDKAELQQRFGTFDKRNVACMIALAQEGDVPRTIDQTEKTCQTFLEHWNHEHPDQPVSTQFGADELARLSIGADLISDKKRDTVARTGGDYIESIKEIQESAEYDSADISSFLQRDIEIAENSIGKNPDREKEWDIVRARYADDMREESERLKQIEAEFDAEFMDCYTKIKQVEQSELPTEQKEVLMKQYNDSFMKAYLMREKAKASANDAFEKSMELSKGLEDSHRSKFVGVGGNKHLEITQGLIREQGKAVPDFKGTCGCCSCANAITLLGGKAGEKDVVTTARKIGACIDVPKQPIDKSPTNEWLDAERNRIARNGGTDAMDRKDILAEFGFNCKNTYKQSLSDLHSHIGKGEAVVFNLDASVLNKSVPTMAFNTTNHAVCVTGLEVDEQTGEPIGVWIRDTGNNSDMGCNVFFGKEDFDLLMNNLSCIVQYVSKKEK